jgi:hypothetical protein
MPRMYYWIVAALNEHDLTTTAAMSHLAITLFDRCRIANWQRQFYEQADQMRDFLLPDGARVYHSGFAGK